MQYKKKTTQSGTGLLEIEDTSKALLHTGSQAKVIALEKAKLKAEEDFKRSMDVSPMGIRVVTPDGKTIYANRAVLDMFGFKTLAELKFTPNKKLYTPDSYREHQARVIKRRRLEFVPSKYETKIIRKNGEIRCLEILRKEVMWQGTPHFQVIYQDITERKKAEEALRESEERFRRLVENAPDVIFRYELVPHTHFTFINKNITNMSGYTPEDFYTDKSLALKVVHPDDLELVKSLNPNNMVPGIPEVIRLVRKDGTLAWIEIRCIPVRDKEEKLIAFEATVRDITIRKQTEEMLLTLITSSPIGIYTIHDKKFQYVNPRFREFTGYSESELLGMNPLALIFPGDVEKVKTSAVKMLKGEQTTPYEFRYVTKTGEIKWGLEKVAPLDYPGQRTTLGSIMDITQHKLMEKEIIQRELEVATAHETDRLKDQLLSVVSHELRTPLASIKGYCTLLLDYNLKLKAAQKKESLTAIDKASDRLAELIDHLLDMSRLEAGLLKLNKMYTDISAIITQAIYEAKLRAPGYNIQLTMEPNLPKLYIDVRRVRQVLDNLLDNAIKYSQPGTEIVAGACRQGEELLVSVSDQGIGIPAKEYNKVFDRLYRIEQRLSQDPGGLGLGLSLCKALVEGHGGRIWLTSQVGKGSTFYFTVPVKSKTCPAQDLGIA